MAEKANVIVKFMLSARKRRGICFFSATIFIITIFLFFLSVYFIWTAFAGTSFGVTIRIDGNLAILFFLCGLFIVYGKMDM